MASRVEQGKGRARHAKEALALGAAVAFAAALGLARASHPGTAPASGTTSSSSSITSEQDDGSFAFGDGSIQPSSGFAPQVQSGVS